MKHVWLCVNIVICGCLGGLLQGILPAQAEEPPPVMTLQHCLEYGVRHAPLLQGETARITQSKAIFQQSKASHGLAIDAKASLGIAFLRFPPFKLPNLKVTDPERSFNSRLIILMELAKPLWISSPE